MISLPATYISLATKLSKELGLLGNDVENLPAMTMKDQMQERIAEHGLRSIKGKLVHSLNEAIAFYDNEGLDEVVVKPNYSAGSTNVRICLNRDEMINAVNALFNDINHYGDMLEDLLIQERIKG